MTTGSTARLDPVWGLFLASLLVQTACEQTQAYPFGEPSTDGVAEARSARLKALSIPTNGIEMNAPQKVRFYRYWDPNPPPSPGLHSCFVLPDDASYHTIMTATFTTVSTTQYIDLTFSAQLTVSSGTSDPFRGITGLATATQDGGEFGTLSQIFPGIGDEFAPFVARRDNASNGQQIYGGYQGIVTAEPDTNTTVKVELKSTQGIAYACFFNMTVRY